VQTCAAAAVRCVSFYVGGNAQGYVHYCSRVPYRRLYQQREGVTLSRDGDLLYERWFPGAGAQCPGVGANKV
jgi:hypothetical protein